MDMLVVYADGSLLTHCGVSGFFLLERKSA